MQHIDKDDRKIIEFINIKLSAIGQPIYGDENDYPTLQMSRGLLAVYQEKSRLLENYLSPPDYRIQCFLDRYFAECPGVTVPQIPRRSLVLDRAGMARVTSMPPNRDQYISDIISSYRVKQGVLHNPVRDRRTTKGVFHVAEGGLEIPADKKSVPQVAFANLLKAALDPPQNLLELPMTSEQDRKAFTFMSLLLRPTVCPEVPGISSKKSMEIRFFAPAALASNLDFVESIFGNGGNPNLTENDAALSPESWTGHTGCVILAPHLTTLTKKELGLPQIEHATERQKRDGMCWTSANELYNNGDAFKITARDRSGVIVTVVADNYFGYCKKEVKTQISFSANLSGNYEEEHAGGALSFPRYNLGEDFQLSTYRPIDDYNFDKMVNSYAPMMDVQPEGYGIDKRWPDILYVPENVSISLRSQSINWTNDKGEHSIKLLANHTYILPSGYKVQLEKPEGSDLWRLIGTLANGTYCHKPCTVSGGGKSEISKSIGDAIIQGPVIVKDFEKDLELVTEVINKNFVTRFPGTDPKTDKSRPILGNQRSLGSVIKLLNPNDEYTDEYNAWLNTIPSHVKELVLLVKRFYRPEWGDDWKQYFSVDVINGIHGHELKFRNDKLTTRYLRIGFLANQSWRVFTLRKDFYPAAKIQMEDDISASVIVPSEQIAGLNTDYTNKSIKFVENCENRLFQRPDDAIIRGYDKQAEKDLSDSDNFLSNFEPLAISNAKEIIEKIVHFDQFTENMQTMIKSFANDPDSPTYFCSSSHPRIVDGKQSKNPRYLQKRQDLLHPRETYIAEVGTRLYRRIPLEQAVPHPVNAVLPGRRNNTKEQGVRPLAVFNPIHYMELPELFMEFISSITGKSPSTTGAGSEGALTKGPFNAILPVYDLNSALLSYILTGYDGFVTAAGNIGPNYKVSHDISLLVPEIWCRMTVEERRPQYLIENGFLEQCEDFEHKGQTVRASRLGYRINKRFAKYFLGRIFSSPDIVLTNEILKPELQNMEEYVDGVDNIVTGQKNVAQNYFDDNSIEFACPPLKALLHIMLHGHYEGKKLEDPEVRNLFEYDTVTQSDWYIERLKAFQHTETQRLDKSINHIEAFLERESHREEAERLNLRYRLNKAREQRKKVSGEAYLDEIKGCIGAEASLVLSPLMTSG